MFRAMADAWAPGSPELRCYNGTYVQLNYYEPSQHNAELLQDSHEDAHLLTLAKSNAPGLEIEVDGKYVPAGADGNEIVFMPGSLLSLMTGYKIKPGYHQVRNTHRRDTRSSLLLFVNPEIDQKLEPWIKNESNAGIDIIERANEGPKQFGMPTLVDGTAGEAFPELMEHKEAVLAEQSQPVRAKALARPPFLRPARTVHRRRDWPETVHHGLLPRAVRTVRVLRRLADGLGGQSRIVQLLTGHRESNGSVVEQDGSGRMVGLVDSQRSLLIFLGVATLIALGALLAPGTVWLLDVLTGIVAAAAAFMACTRLALGTPNVAARRAWQAALVLFGIVCVGQLVAAFGIAPSRWRSRDCCWWRLLSRSGWSRDTIPYLPSHDVCSGRPSQFRPRA